MKRRNRWSKPVYRYYPLKLLVKAINDDLYAKLLERQLRSTSNTLGVPEKILRRLEPR